MKKWLGVSLGIHVAMFGVVASQPAPTRNLVTPGKVYSVSLVSFPVAASRPEAKAAGAEKTIEPIKPKPQTPAEDREAIKPPSTRPRKSEAEAKPEKPEEAPEEKLEEKKADEPHVPREEPPRAAAAVGDRDTAGVAGAVVTSALGGSGTQGTVSLDSADFGFSYYLVSLQANVAANWFPPGSVGAPGEVLRATVHFRVMTDGTIEDATIERSSGVPYFDRCALRAILLSSPLAPLPAEFEEDELGVHFEFTHTVSVR